jgi:hypothetical protein
LHWQGKGVLQLAAIQVGEVNLSPESQWLVFPQPVRWDGEGRDLLMGTEVERVHWTVLQFLRYEERIVPVHASAYCFCKMLQFCPLRIFQPASIQSDAITRALLLLFQTLINFDIISLGFFNTYTFIISYSLVIEK